MEMGFIRQQIVSRIILNSKQNVIRQQGILGKEQPTAHERLQGVERLTSFSSVTPARTLFPKKKRSESLSRHHFLGRC